MTREDIIEILKEITLEGPMLNWEIKVFPEMRSANSYEIPYLQVQFTTPEGRQYGRKWRLSPHMTKSEIVLTAFKAVETAMEHEVREAFRYRDRRIFGPHIDVDELWKVSRNVDIREEMRMAR